MQPVPFILDKPLDEMYEEWKTKWLKYEQNLPTKSDFTWKDKWGGYENTVYPEWLEALEPYASSPDLSKRYFAVYVLCHKAMA